MLAFDFDRGADGLQYVTDDAWISELGIRWSLGVDGLNLWLILLTALLWVGAIVYAWRAERFRSRQRPQLFWFHVGAGGDGRARRVHAPRTSPSSSSSST